MDKKPFYEIVRTLLDALFHEHYSEIFIRPTTHDNHLREASPFGYKLYSRLMNTKITSQSVTTSKYRIDDYAVMKGIDNREEFINDMKNNFSIEWLVLNIDIDYHAGK